MQMPSSQKIDKEIFRTIFIDYWESFKRPTQTGTDKTMKVSVYPCVSVAKN